MSQRTYLRSAEKERVWRGILRRHAAGKLSVRGFCRNEGLKESAFYFWKRTIAQRDRERGSKRSTRGSQQRFVKGQRGRTRAAAEFVPLAVVGETARLEILAPNGWRVRVPNGVDGETLSEVVAVLCGSVGEETA